ncbi:MAG: Lrp/AsnC family transcriptional regulator [Chloroflexi bacterium]|nr:Lrp/AsnC family transcriptional regulator [Chloroflexota bacterium]
MNNKKTEVLKALQIDARLSYEELGKQTGISAQEAQDIVKKAENDKEILAYKTVINWEKMDGAEEVLALIEVKTTPQTEVGFDAIAANVCRFPEARDVYLVSGDYDLCVIVKGKSMRQIADFVSQKLAPTEGVQATATYFLMKKYKEDGHIVDNYDDVRRQMMML